MSEPTAEEVDRILADMRGFLAIMPNGKLLDASPQALKDAVTLAAALEAERAEHEVTKALLRNIVTFVSAETQWSAGRAMRYPAKEGGIGDAIIIVERAKMKRREAEGAK